MNRREFVGLSLGGLLGQLAGPETASIPVPRVNGGINIQPLRRLDQGARFTPPLIVPELVDAQMRALYELGFEQIRLTISFNRFGPDFLAAIPYVRAARALGIDVLGIIGQFSGLDLVQALSDPKSREEVLETYYQIFSPPSIPASDAMSSGGFAAQILNEPTHFLGLPPDVYVRDYLRPAFYHLREDDPNLTVVSAAPIGSAEGLLRAREMIATGLELYCDRVAFHVYSTRFLRELDGLTDQAVWVTESGVSPTGLHLDWMTVTFDRIRAELPKAERIFWFELFDFDVGKFRLIDLVPRLDGDVEVVVESKPAVEFLRSRVAAALGGNAATPYRELVPDISMYLPTEEDLRIIRNTSIGAETWPS